MVAASAGAQGAVVAHHGQPKGWGDASVCRHKHHGTVAEAPRQSRAPAGPDRAGSLQEMAHPNWSTASRRRVLVAVVAVLVGGTVVARRLGYSGMGGNTIVRCRQGHLFTTIWVPGVSVKSVRLGWARWQRCPVGPHWSLVTPVRDADLTDEERRTAKERRDVRLP